MLKLQRKQEQWEHFSVRCAHAKIITSCFLQHSKLLEFPGVTDQEVMYDQSATKCVQKSMVGGGYSGSENCLYLNVFLPEVRFFWYCRVFQSSYLRFAWVKHDSRQIFELQNWIILSTHFPSIRKESLYLCEVHSLIFPAFFFFA